MHSAEEGIEGALHYSELRHRRYPLTFELSWQLAPESLPSEEEGGKDGVVCDLFGLLRSDLKPQPI